MGCNERVWTTRAGPACVGLAAGFCAAVATPTAQAEPIGPTRLCEVYPLAPECAGGPPDCTICHTSTEPEAPAWNAYGDALVEALAGGDFEDWITDALLAVDGDDADGDGFSNGDELLTGSHPGDPDSVPADPTCPDDVSDLPFALCTYDYAFAYKRVSLDFCGASPTFAQMEAFRALDDGQAEAAIADTLDACLDSEFWRGEGGVLWQLAYPKVRPVRALKAGRGASEIEQLRIADYNNDIALYVWAQVDGNDARAVLTADFYVLQDGLDFAVVPDIGPQSDLACGDDSACPSNETCIDGTCQCPGNCVEAVQTDRRRGLLTTRWNLLYNTMFTPIPRTTAAQAYRAFLGLDIAKQQGLDPVAGEPVDYDAKGVTAPACAVCHTTLDPLSYPFTTYTGFGPGGRAIYVEDRMTLPPIAGQAPNIAATPEAGVIFGQEVDDLRQWADVAADSEQFAQNAVSDYWTRLVGHAPQGDVEAAEFAALWTDLMGDRAYSIEAMLHDLVRTEAYGAP